MPLALGCRAENRDDTPERIDLDRRRVDGARLRQVLGLGAELRVARGRDVAYVGAGGPPRERKADPEIAAGRPRPRLLATELGVLRELERLVERRLVIARVVETTRRSSIRKRVGRDEIPPPHFCRIQSHLVGEPVDHPLALEVEVAARVAAVRPREALVGHDDGSVDFQILKAIRAAKITGRAKTTSRFGAPDVATDITQPAEA